MRFKGAIRPPIQLGQRPIMNVEVNREEANDINFWARHVIRMMKDWIKKPFQFDPILDTVIFHAKPT